MVGLLDRRVGRISVGHQRKICYDHLKWLGNKYSREQGVGNRGKMQSGKPESRGG